MIYVFYISFYEAFQLLEVEHVIDHVQKKVTLTPLLLKDSGLTYVTLESQRTPVLTMLS